MEILLLLYLIPMFIMFAICAIMTYQEATTTYRDIFLVCGFGCVPIVNIFFVIASIIYFINCRYMQDLLNRPVRKSTKTAK